MLGQTVEAIRQLESGNGEVIVDIKISTGAEKEAELKRNGYTQVLPAASALAGIDPATFGSFGRGNGIWIWKRRQGTCSGRLKPIIDIQLDASATSSSSVLIGYSCIPLSVAGQFVWIKRASTEEEEKDAIVDLRVTIGKMKNIADKIWTNPGMYVLVSQSGTGQSGNFNRGMFSSTDAFLWFRPMRTRTTESAMVSVISSLSQLSEESKKVRLLAAARNAIRHFVPLSEVKRLANLQMESSEAESKLQLRSERLFDYSSLFHQYGNSTKGILSRRNFAKMMVDIGMNMDPQDLTRCYNYFDKDLNGKLSRVEFANVVALTDHEIDCIVDKIRARLLVSGGSSGKAGGGASSLQSQPGIINPKAAAAAAAAQAKPRNEFRESRILSHIFRHVNVNNDCILSLDEVLDLTARLEIFLTEAEARRIARDMDVDMDDRIEEADFITFMKRPSEVVSKKAGRLHAATFQLRKWLIGGSNAKGSTNVLATEMQWNDLKSRHERSTLRKFPGYLTSEDLLMVLSAQSVLLSGAEARELLLLVAPEGNGQVRQPDLHAFMNRQCRSLGELVALLERDVMNSIVEVYRTHRAAIRTDGVADSELSDRFQAQVLEYVKRIQTSQASRDGAARSGSTVHDVVSVAQLKAGIEASMGRAPLNGASAMPNLEEYACLGSLVGASVADEDTFGINARAFVEGICNYIVRDKASGSTETVSLEAMCRNLRKMIREEAKAAGGGRNYDYVATFASFDEDGGGTISLNEFRKMLTRLQLLTKLPEKQVPKLLAMFDRGAKGFVTFDDFLSFVELAKDDDDDDHALDDDEADDETLGLSSNTPPASITRNADCDWLLWFLWRQSCRIAPRDPENAIAELGSACDAAEKRGSSGAAVMTVKAFWSLLVDKKLCGSMTRAQFDKGIKFVVHDGTGRDDDGLDHESLCNYVVKMGRAFNGLLQQRRTVDEKKFVQLRASLIKELLEIDASSLAAAAAGEEDAIVSPGQSIGSRFERVLRRLDTNSDGLLTVPEFKLALKRLKIRDEKRWSAAMVRRLFDESSVRVDGMLHIGEFGKSVRGELDASRAAGRPNELSDDEDDDVFALPKAATTDSALYRKTSEILLELVPMTSSSYSPGAVSAHCDAVRATIRHFFQKSDPDASGAVDEDTFRLFCRKSGLQSRLRVAELRKLCSKLRRRGGDSRDGRPGRDAQIDYEKLCKLVGPGAESQPRSRVDALMQRLQEAAAQSEQAGRSFLALCTLTDPRLTGRVSNEEFAIVAKMLGCPMTLPEVDIIKEQLADIDVENLEASRGNANHGRRGRDGDDEREFTRGGASGVDYRKVNHLIETYQSSTRPSPSPYGDVDPYGVTGTMRNTRSLGALPSYAVSSVTRMPSTGVPRLDISRVLPTPGGLFLATPQGVGTPLRASMGASLPRDMGRSGGLGASAGLSASMGFGMGMGSSGVNLGTLGRSSGAGLGATVYDRSLALMADKVVAACARQARGTSPFIHLRRRLETADRGHVGLATEEAVQVVLEDLGVSLSAPDLYLIRTRFGNTAGSVDYEALVQALSESAGAAARSGAGAGAGGVFSAGVGRRLRELVREGVELRRVFADYDFDGLGVVRVPPATFSPSHQKTSRVIIPMTPLD